jgi:DNA-binding MarR family transcriptional regulator
VDQIKHTLGHQLIQLCRSHHYRADSLLHAIGLYAGQEMILFQLWRENGQSQTQLARRMCVEPPTITKMLQRMESTSLVERRPDAEDARVSRVYLTEQSAAMEARVTEAWAQLEAEMLEDFSDEEQATLRHLLEKAVANLER